MNTVKTMKAVLSFALGLGMITSAAVDLKAEDTGEKTSETQKRYVHALEKLVHQHDSVSKADQTSDGADAEAVLRAYLEENGYFSEGNYVASFLWTWTDEVKELVEITYNPDVSYVNFTYLHSSGSVVEGGVREELSFSAYLHDLYDSEYTDIRIRLDDLAAPDIRQPYYSIASGEGFNAAEIRFDGSYEWGRYRKSGSHEELLNYVNDKEMSAYLNSLIPVAMVYYDIALQDLGISLYELGFSTIYYPFIQADEADLETDESLSLHAAVYPEAAGIDSVHWAYPSYLVSLSGDGLNCELRGRTAGTGSLTAITDNGAADSIALSVSNTEPDPVRSEYFADVRDRNRYYFNPVYWAYDNGITTGTSQNPLKFTPEEKVTRGQIVSFLYRLAGSPDVSGEMPFDDVDVKRYYYKPILWAYQNSITTGTSADKFSPDIPCTREQIVTFLWRYLNKPEPFRRVGFTDSKTDAYYTDALSWAYDNGVTTGLNDGTGRFGVGQTCTRAMAVTFLYRAGY